MLNIDHSTFITVMDRDRTLYAVRKLKLGSGSGTTVAAARSRPAMLLGGEAEVTAFVGRETEMSTLEQWYDGPEPVSVMLVHGAGGQGKTRLLREFARSVGLRGERPQVCEAVSLTEAPVQGMAGAEEEANDGAAHAGILLVVDEADVWPARKLVKLFGDAAAWRSGRVRVLLSARAAGIWWTGLRAQFNRPEIPFRELRLKSLDAAGQRELADRAGRGLAKRLGWQQPPPLPDEVLSPLAESPPLSIELMVLARMLASASGRRKPADLRPAVELVLEKELRYWARMYSLEDGAAAGLDPYRIQLHPSFMARAVYVATLAGPLGPAKALQAVELARIGCSIEPQHVIDDHARCCPPEDANLILAPLPPCLAEEFLGMLVPGSGSQAAVMPPDGWATGAPFHILGLLSPDERKAEAVTRRRCQEIGLTPLPPAPQYSLELTFGPRLNRMILNLVRVASTRPHVADQQLYPLARHYPKAVVMAGSAVLRELAEIRPEPPDDVRKALEKAAAECDPDNLSDYQAAINALQRRASHEQRSENSGRNHP